MKTNFTIYRSDQKFQTLLTNIGGFIKLIMVACSLICTGYNSKSFILRLMKDIFVLGEATELNKLSSSLSNFQVKKNSYLNNADLSNSQLFRVKTNVSIKELVNSRSNSNKISSIGIVSLYKWLVCSKCLFVNNKKFNEVYNQGVKEIGKRLDFLFYIKQIQIQDHILETLYYPVQKQILIAYQKEDLEKTVSSAHVKSEDEIISYFKDSFKTLEVRELDLKIFDMLPQRLKKIISE